MIKNKFFVLLVILSIVLSACAGPVNAPDLPVDPNNLTQPTANAVQSAANTDVPPATATVVDNVPVSVEHHSDVDLTHLTVGDGKYSTSPQMGYVYSCMTSFNGGGAQGTGPWMNGDGTWDATKKAVIDGSVTWPHSFTISVQGNQRVFTGNDLPDHPTGNYPVASSDDAYAYDRNPNSIKEQSITFSLPVNPVESAQPNCVGGEIGIMLSGAVIFSAFDAEGRDAAAHEVQDNCDGHPQVSGFYHYHSLSDCFVDNTAGHSALMGYAFDGYGIYGYYGEDGAEITNADLDVCHGHTHVIEWEGQIVSMYHYHATHEFPYVVGCFHGQTAVRALSGGEGQQQGGATQSGQNNQGNNQQPPQAALDACLNLSINSTCSFTTPNGTLNGTCIMPQNLNQLVCAPAGGMQSP